MDSGNSGSMQSSSGGDEEYDSRSESISALMNSSAHVGAVSNQQLLPSLHHHLNQSATLDPISNYLDPFSRPQAPPNSNPMLNFDMVWPPGIRSEPNCTDTGALMASSPSSQLILGSQDSVRTPLPNPSSMSLPQQGPENGARASSVTSDHQANTVRNSKKRSRASRRAPTTVLTTDTSNFRAMVQEFTGIPAPPFSASPFSRTRLDLFRTNTPTTMKSAHFDPTPSAPPPPPPYLLRPFAQKVQPPPFVSSSFSSSNMADGIIPTSNNIGSTTTNTASSATSNNPSNFASTSNYQLLSDQLGLPKQTQNLLDMQNPILTFQSLLSSSPPPPTSYPLANVPISSTAKPQGSTTVLSADPRLKMGLLEELDVNHGRVGAEVGGLPNLVISEGMPVDRNTSRWGEGMGLHEGNQVPSRSFNVNYGSSVQRVNGCSSSDFHAEKASDQNVSSRGEGMVDSWICSSD